MERVLELLRDPFTRKDYERLMRVSARTSTQFGREMERRFVQAFARAVGPGDTLGLLMEIGALGSPDTSIVLRTREALAPAYDRATGEKDRE